MLTKAERKAALADIGKLAMPINELIDAIAVAIDQATTAKCVRLLKQETGGAAECWGEWLEELEGGKPSARAREPVDLDAWEKQ